MVKVIFTFDERTVETLRRAAARLKKPSSVVVREAIQDYASRADRLSDEERSHMLKALDRIAARPPNRMSDEVDAEIKEIRATRKRSGRSQNRH